MGTQTKPMKKKFPDEQPTGNSYDRFTVIQHNRREAAALERINRVLFVLLIPAVAAVAWYGFYLYMHDYRTNMARLDKLGSARVAVRESAAISTTPQPLDISLINRRNIFVKYRDQEPVGPRVSTKDSHKFKSSIRVVGITYDKDYEVLIEDLEKKETVLLTKGKSIAGATLIEITDKKLVFELDNDRIELEL